MAITRNEEAVSPVIGVILMVAITVILAAVIAAFVFGMAGNISKTKVVAATAQQPDSDTIVATYQGGQDAGTCDYIVWTVTDDTGTEHEDTMGEPGGSVLTVGTSLTFTQPGLFAGRNHAVGVATFTDGSSQVILDNFI